MSDLFGNHIVGLKLTVWSALRWLYVASGTYHQFLYATMWWPIIGIKFYSILLYSLVKCITSRLAAPTG